MATSSVVVSPFETTTIKTNIKLLPLTLDLVFYAGADSILKFPFYSPDAAEPVDMTGSHQAHIRSDPSSFGGPDAEFVIDDSRAAQGYVTLTLPGTVTQNLCMLPDGTFQQIWNGAWDWCVDRQGSLAYLYTGQVYIQSNVTRLG